MICRAPTGGWASEFSDLHIDTPPLLLNTRSAMMHGTGPGNPKRSQSALLLMIGAAVVSLGCLIGASISAESWAELFHHPARQPRPEVTMQGARLWRVMLVVLAASALAFPLVLLKINDKRIHCETPANDLGGKRVWILIGIVAVAIGFRAFRLNESLWYDEIASWMTYSAGVPSAWPIVGNFRDPINQVAHTVLAHFSIQYLSEALGIELAFRLPAFAFSILSALAMFGLGRAAFGERIGVIAALLAAMLPVSVLEGAESRSYSMMICFSALMSWSWLEAVHRKRAWLWCAYALCCAIGIWAHFVAAFVPIGHAAWLLWHAARQREWTLLLCGGLALALGAILTFTLFAPMLPDMLFSKEMFFTDRGDEPRVLGPEGLHALLQVGGSWYWWAALPGLTLAGIGLRVAMREPAARSAAAITLLGLPLMVLTVIIAQSWIYARFTFFALPGSMLLIALGIEALRRRAPMLAFAAIGVVVACSIVDLALRPPKQPLRDAADHVRRHWQSGDRLVIMGLAHPVSEIYLHDLQPKYSFFFGADLEPKLDAIAPKWVIIEYPHHVSGDRHELLAARGYEVAQPLEGWADWKHGDVIVMKRRP